MAKNQRPQATTRRAVTRRGMGPLGLMAGVPFLLALREFSLHWSTNGPSMEYFCLDVVINCHDVLLSLAISSLVVLIMKLL